ncbi:WD repeat-containing protein 88 [Callorhinchus milii]|uniref:Uncharacterized protein n=2 Tax=Callorhinchus milii TaxID=7868 RepID=A0A4W3JFL1_CALMI|nr:WD repeat-containing protein 88 [Callorhinchus milii]
MLSPCQPHPLALEEPQEPPNPQDPKEESPDQSLAKIPYRIFEGHTDAVTSCQFCFDNTKFLTCSFDKTARLWDVASGTTVQVYEGDISQPLSECCLSPDGKRLFTSSWDRTLKAWDVETGKVIWSVQMGSLVTCCDVSQDGKLVVSGSDLDNSVLISHAQTGAKIVYLREHHQGSVMSCCFDPEIHHVATSSCDKTVLIWDLVAQKTTITLKKHSSVVSDCCFSHKLNSLCTASWDKTLQLWDIKTGEYRTRGPISFIDGHDGCISSCVFSHDGSLIVAGAYDKTISIWDSARAYRKLFLKGHKDWVMDVDLSSDSKWILSGCKDATLRMWNIERINSVAIVNIEDKEKGMRVIQCKQCRRNFSIFQLDLGAPVLCVFCRLGMLSSPPEP